MSLLSIFFQPNQLRNYVLRAGRSQMGVDGLRGLLEIFGSRRLSRRRRCRRPVLLSGSRLCCCPGLGVASWWGRCGGIIPSVVSPLVVLWAAPHRDGDMVLVLLHQGPRLQCLFPLQPPWWGMRLHRPVSGRVWGSLQWEGFACSPDVG